MKLLIQALVAGLFFLLLIPLIVGLLLGDGGLTGTGEAGENLKNIDFEGKVELPDTIRVWMEEEGEVIEVDFEEYVSHVVASEMPYTFDEEALKAQSVAARTFSAAKLEKYKEQKPSTHPDAPVCNTTHCQVYKTEEELIASHEEGWANEGWEKIKKACQATEGELLYYDGEMVMQPLFFSSSGGQTENSEDVFVGAYPYLISVASPYEEEATHRDEEKKFTLKEFKKQIEEAYPEMSFGEINRSNIKILSRTSGGRVAEMQIGDGVLKGTEVRSALGLSSALFSISFESSGESDAEKDSGITIVFTSSGSGHGVGMSQYGANGMAKEGYDYKEILQHYYTGTEIY